MFPMCMCVKIHTYIHASDNIEALMYVKPPPATSRALIGAVKLLFHVKDAHISFTYHSHVTHDGATQRILLQIA